MSHSSDVGSRRIEWLDQLKVIAAMLMVLDHTLSYFGEGSWCFWIRATFTRAVEPLYAFIFGYLFIRGGMRINWKRYGQIALASLCASIIHSLHHNELRLDMLFNFVVVMPLLPWLLRMPRPLQWTVYVLCSVTSAWALTPIGIGWDYGPFLLLTQTLLTATILRNDNWFSFLKVIVGFGGLTVGIALTSAYELGMSNNALVIAVGHPIAACLIVCIRQKGRLTSSSSSFPTRRPLLFYVGHLLILHLLFYCP